MARTGAERGGHMSRVLKNYLKIFKNDVKDRGGGGGGFKKSSLEITK